MNSSYRVEIRDAPGADMVEVEVPGVGTRIRMADSMQEIEYSTRGLLFDQGCGDWATALITYRRWYGSGPTAQTAIGVWIPK